MLEIMNAANWNEAFSSDQQLNACQRLENGKILFFPQLPFQLLPEEKIFLSPDYVDPSAKNISYHAESQKLWGVQKLTDQQHTQLKIMLDRFAANAFELIRHLLPSYVPHLTIARTSFRPVQVSNRKTSFRKDDKRLHVDAFPSAPNQGKRILRVFCNINPHGEDRVWRVGEPFETVAKRFLPEIKKPIAGSAHALRMLRITKSYRTKYDHYMLQLHDHMKMNESYQQTALQEEIRFAPNTTWIVQTDDVSHAAMAGQYVLEQTFYLPVTAMQDESRSPLKILERLLGEALV